MKVARFVLKIVALALDVAKAADKLLELGTGVGEKLKKSTGRPSEYDDYVEE